ncbi:MAG: SRPBCC family protein [Bacteroidota bacterium]
MKYTTQVEINRPVAEVIKLFDDPDNLAKWQDGLQSFEHLSGTPGKTGAKSRLVYQIGRRTIEMIETIESRNLPDEFSGTYEAKNVFNRVVNRFTPIEENKTLYVAEQEFKFSGFMKIMAWLTPGAFRKESQKSLEAFKKFAETEVDK